MDKKQKFRVVVMIPLLAVLIVLGLVLTGVMIIGSGKPKPPTALASVTEPVETH
jgi:hypothetical protein